MTAESAFGSSEQEPLPWWLALIEGAALILTGLLFLSKPGMTTVVIVQIMGLYWIFAGILSIVRMFIDSSNWGWKLIGGLVGIIAGILILRHPLWSSAILGNTLIIILGIGGIIIGIVNIVQAFRGAGWGAGLLGVVSLILGIVLLANIWLFTFSLPWTLGVLSLIGGIAIVFGAFRLRSDEKAAKEALAAKAAADEKAATDAAAAEAKAAANAAEADAKAAAEAAEAEAKAAAEAAEAGAGAAVRAGAATAIVAEVADEAEEDTGILNEEADKAKFGQPLTYIEGIGPAYSDALNAVGITSPNELLEKGATRHGRLEIAEKAQISIKLVTRWVNQVDLYRVPGIGPQYGDLLERSGVNTVPELAQRNPKNLHDKLVEVNTEKNLVREVAGLHQVEKWIAVAKGLPAKITF